MTRKQKHLLTRILVAAVLFLAGSLLHLPEYVEMGVFLVCYAVVGWDIVWKAITNILHGQVFDENFLMTIATIGALILGEHSEGVAVMLFYQVGEWFQSYAVSKSRKSIASLMDIRPDYANVEQDGKLVQVDPDKVQIGSVIVVKPGERIPLDGTIIKGSSALDTSALTGESMPREVEPGMEVISGCINQTGILTIQTTKEFGESTVAKILDLVENASDKKGKTENFITRFARYYTPAVVFAALALAVLPPLITGQAFGVWIYRALTFLVISCPCALVISIPLSFFGGIGGASKIGVLVKGSNYLESLAHAEVVVFDKTGTLTKGSFAVSEIHPNGMKEEKLLELAAYAEDYSNHPISLSIKKAYGKKIDNSRISNVQEIAGHGVQAVIDGKSVLAGNAKLMEKEHIKYKPSVSIGTVVYLACDGKYAGCIVIEDEVKEDAPAAIKLLKSSGIRKTVIAALDLHAFGIMPGITDRAATAASAKRLFQIILSFFAVCVILEKHIRRQLAVRIAAARGKHLIDFVLCNESGAFYLELPIQGKDFCRDLRLLKPVQNGVGAVKMEPQDFPVRLVSIAEALHFFYNSRQLLRGLQQLF